MPTAVVEFRQALDLVIFPVLALSLALAGALVLGLVRDLVSWLWADGGRDGFWGSWRPL